VGAQLAGTALLTLAERNLFGTKKPPERASRFYVFGEVLCIV
jgi:hypothetical protein